MMNRLSFFRTSKFGVAFQLSVITTFLILIGFGVMALIFYWNTQKQITANLKQETTDTLRFSAMAFSIPVWDFQERQIKALADSLLRQEKQMIRAIRIKDVNSKLLGEFYNESDSDQDFDKLVKDNDQDEDLLYSQVPIIYNEKKIGEIEVLTSSKKIKAEFIKRLQNGFAMMLLISFFMSGLLYIYNKYFLRYPLYHLSRLPDELKDRDFNFNSEHFQWKHEFETIAMAFLDYHHEIKKKDLELKAYSENLEHLVEVRTKELELQKTKLVQSSRLAALGEMSAGIAHEVNNPLTVISGMAQKIRRTLETTDAPSKDSVFQNLEKINSMVHRISKIIQGLRTFAREGTFDKKTLLRVSDTLDAVKDLTANRMIKKSVAFECILESTNLSVFASEVQLVQVLVNLINNATDAIDKIDNKWINLTAHEDPDWTFLQVTDSGNGIPEEIQEKMMQPFFTTKEAGVGTGLGLSISAGIISNMGGQLYYDKNSKHTCFVIKLPKKEIIIKEKKAA
jgi:C4-dicarboxylate-specific signal transduction histidine kinase